MAEFYQHRRSERERIALMGVPELWELSPPLSEVSDEEEAQKPKKWEVYKTLAEMETGSDSDSEEETRKKKRKSKKHHKKRSSKKKKRKAKQSSSESDNNSSESDKDSDAVWVEKKEKSGKSDAFVGPVPEVSVQKSSGRLDYGGALLPGEGEAMAAYVAEGKRIPRRGEIGLTSDEIELFEDSGYVMSGSRHRRMEAVRIRKENQVYSADDKYALAMYNHEERKKRENRILSEFRSMVHKKMSTKKE
ncbi:NKAP-like protein [Dysidea avara]|uniref:NKAP-like protein n=1 Tax=Dysidea avara TaxID=196820 RepID=UPI00333159B3